MTGEVRWEGWKLWVSASLGRCRSDLLPQETTLVPLFGNVAVLQQRNKSNVFWVECFEVQPPRIGERRFSFRWSCDALRRNEQEKQSHVGLWDGPSSAAVTKSPLAIHGGVYISLCFKLLFSFFFPWGWGIWEVFSSLWGSIIHPWLPSPQAAFGPALTHVGRVRMAPC